MSHRIATLIIPAAGQGTRLLPATKAVPKELLPIYDRPALQFAIDEAIALGVARIVVVIHPAKRAIRDYLAPDARLVAQLLACGKARLAAALIEIEVPPGIEVVLVEQDQPLGLGHAVLCAEPVTLPGVFAVLLPDDLVFGRPCLPEMAESYAGGHMIAAMEVPPDEASAYGIFQLQTPAIGRMVAVSGMVEKPGPGQAPSRLAAVGRYILDPGIFATLRHVLRGAGGEIQLTDAIAQDAGRVALSAFRFSGARFDCGSHDGLLGAALARQAEVRGHDARGTPLRGPNVDVSGNDRGPRRVS